jgi:hypothetical protein
MRVGNALHVTCYRDEFYHPFDRALPVCQSQKIIYFTARVGSLSGKGEMKIKDCRKSNGKGIETDNKTDVKMSPLWEKAG